MPPRGSNTERMQLCGLSKARPISCSDCPAFHRFQTSRFSIAENPNRCPGLMPTPPLHSRLTSDGVASTCRMHRGNRTNKVILHMYGNPTCRPLERAGEADSFSKYARRFFGIGANPVHHIA